MFTWGSTEAMPFPIRLLLIRYKLKAVSFICLS